MDCCKYCKYNNQDGLCNYFLQPIDYLEDNEVCDFLVISSIFRGDKNE